ncbi:MAG: TonB-dependent receptor [Acidobacteriaceae bacterium]|nr:TonB-dependent receptor [Acidobacteriaceae bacterium]MBV9778357.1 TonB-dependent receptor [Acidobacteriaceae bacterium]
MAAAHSPAGDLSLPLTGNLLGSVVDASGTPQMGASVQLFNRYERLIAKTLTTPDGRFAFADLPADLYTVRVSLASFLPASRDKIAVKAGTDSLLQIHLATLFSSVELTYAVPTGGMSEDWKWVLRSSPATRPITRLLDEDPDSASAQLHPRIFSGTHAMVSLSGGDGGLIDSDSAQPDLGTGFVLSTNVMGKNQLQLGGSFGQNTGLGSAMGLCAIYSRDANGGFGEPPEVTFTLSQFALMEGQLAGQNPVIGMAGSIPPVRTMSLSIYQVADPTENLHLEYGATGESVDYLQHTTRVSPFARATVGMGRFGEVIAAYSDGGRPDELTAHQLVRAAAEDSPQDFGDDLTGPANTLARLPQLSERNGRLELQRTGNYELGYDKSAGSRTYAVSAFHEDVSNGRINVAGDISVLAPGDLLSDGASMTSTYNVGRYSRNGYLASVDQRVTQSLDLAIAYGRMGGFTADSGRDPATWGTEGKFLDHTNHNLASANLRARAPVSGTQISASYGWVETGAVVPRHMFTTQNIYAQPGFNIIIRQPLPAPFGMPGRLELTADLHNLLAQGYLPLYATDGRRLLIIQSPRAIRGGLNFIF